MFPDFLKSETLEPNHEEFSLMVWDNSELELIEITDHLSLIVRSAED